MYWFAPFVESPSPNLPETELGLPEELIVFDDPEVSESKLEELLKLRYKTCPDVGAAAKAKTGVTNKTPNTAKRDNLFIFMYDYTNNTDAMERNSPLESITKLSLEQRKALSRLGLKTVEDLLRYFPTRYNTPGSIKSVETLLEGDEAALFGKIFALKTGKTFKSRVAISEATFEDTTGKIKLIWFNQPYIAKMFHEGDMVRIEGKVSSRKEVLAVLNPKIEKIKDIPVGVGGSLFTNKDTGEEEHTLYPIYPETRHVTSNWIYHTLQRIFRSGVLEKLEDSIPAEILKKYNLPSLRSALIWIHAPLKIEDAEVARKRFAFEEIFMIQLDRARERTLARKEKAFVIDKSKKDISDFVSTFPFPLTGAQDRVIAAILGDMKKGYPMSRLIEGDVGSGKTAVAAVAAYATVSTVPPKREYGNIQVAYMAPTEILAEQHFESFIEYFGKYNLQVGLLTGSGAKKFPSKVNKEKWTKISKAQLLKWVENGEIPVLIGTHALIQKNVKFKNLGLIVIDEQHRFGIKQRMNLRKKQGSTPHLISMTATPIPRSLALTIFGDLDLSLLDELPPGRKPVNTEIVLPDGREKVYAKVKEELAKGRQAYVICPRVNEPDPTKEMAVNAKSVMEEAARLQKSIFKDYKVLAITGKMTPKEKDSVMQDFKNKKGDLLVATSVVEVGVNVPNATVMIIENAERFGLSQLHQLRGRILRSSFEPFCFVFTESKSKKTVERLRSFIKAKNGFELAEEDLKQRGAGDLVGTRQWGVSDLAMDALKNIKMVEAARTEATNLIEKDFDLKKYPLLKKRLEQSSKPIHLE